MLSVQSKAHAVGPGIARYETRYEDLTQEGHVKLTALPAAVGRACFGQMWSQHPLSAVHRDGVLPILSRLVIECEPRAAKLLGPLEGRGWLSLAHERDANDDVQALFVNARADVWAMPRRGSTRDTQRHVRVGRVFGEHVFTRPLAPRSERKVLAFDVPGVPPVPVDRYTRKTLVQNLAVPVTARALEPEYAADVAPWAFGLTHTDGNQHVNSLVYVRLFEDAALRRLAALGRDLCVLARHVEVSYRKPCFAGEQLTCMLRAHATRDGDVVVGYLVDGDEPLDRARCAIRMQFSPSADTAAPLEAS
jgi:hypothetical protein